MLVVLFCDLGHGERNRSSIESSRGEIWSQSPHDRLARVKIKCSPRDCHWIGYVEKQNYRPAAYFVPNSLIALHQKRLWIVCQPESLAGSPHWKEALLISFAHRQLKPNV